MTNTAKNVGSYANSLGGLLPKRYGQPLKAGSGVSHFQMTSIQETLNNRDLATRFMPSQRIPGPLTFSTPSPFDRTGSLLNLAGSGASMTSGIATMGNRNGFAGKASVFSGTTNLLNEAMKNRDLFLKPGSAYNPTKVDRFESGLNVIGGSADIMGVMSRNRKTQVVAPIVSASMLAGRSIYENRGSITNSASQLNARINTPMTDETRAKVRVKNFQDFYAQH